MSIHCTKLTFATLIASLMILFVWCNQNSIDPKDPAYSGDYKLIPQWSAVDTANLTIFTAYRIPCTFGKDPFTLISAATSPKGFLDTAYFLSLSQSGTLALYAIDTGICTLFIEGIKPNYLRIADTTVITVRNPYRLTGDSLVGIKENVLYRLSPAPTPEATGLDLRVEWIRSDTASTLLKPGDPYRITPAAKGAFTLRACLVDSERGHRFTVASRGITVPGYRPGIDSIRLIDTLMHPGDSVAFHVYAFDRDSGSLAVIAGTEKNGVWRDTFRLATPQMYSTIVTGTRPVVDTGTFVFSVVAVDTSGLRSDSLTDTITVAANPPIVKFQPDTAVMSAPVNYPFTLLVTANADTFAWNIDGKDTVTCEPKLTRIFLTSQKKTSAISVVGIDRYGYKGSARTVRLVEETCFYDLSFKHIPGDSAYYNSAYWEVRTSRPDRVKANNAKFSWVLLRLPAGDTIYRTTLPGTGDSVSTLPVAALAIPGHKLDSADLKVCVVLGDTLPAKNSSPTLNNSSKIRLFRPKLQILSIVPRPDSVSAGQKVLFTFRSFDTNPWGSIDSTFWKYADSPSVRRLAPSIDTLSFSWPTPRTATIYLWNRDDDKQLSDTVKQTLTVIQSAPAVVSMKKPAAAYTKLPCTLSVSARPGFSKSPIKSLRWSITGLGDLVSADSAKVLTFASPGLKKISVTAKDFLGDSSAPFVDSIFVISGKPALRIVSTPDSVPVRIQAVIKCKVTDTNGTVDSLYWKQANDSTVRRIAVKGGDSTIRHTWTASQSVTMSVWAKDNTGDISDTVTAALTVTPGEPVVRGITLATLPIGAYINDQIKFTISASDTNGKLIWYRIVLKKQGGADSLTAKGASAAVFLTALLGNEGVYDIDAYVQDDDSLWSKRYRHPTPITIRAGFPKITAFSPRTVWFNDDTTYSYSVFDSNGYCKTILFNWGDGTKIDTIHPATPPAGQPVSGLIKHRYAAPGVRDVRITAIDDDELTAVLDTIISVKRGTPTVKAVKDTFVMFSFLGFGKGMRTGDTLHCQAAAYDTNGTIRRHVWIFNPPFDTTAKAPDTLITSGGDLKISARTSTFFSDHGLFYSDTTYTAAMYVKDDDGLTALDTFHFYFDGPRDCSPSSITKLSLSHDFAHFEWKNMLNAPDSIYVDVTGLEKAESLYTSMKLILIVDSAATHAGMVPYNDTIAINDYGDYAPIASRMRYDDTKAQWHCAFRPLAGPFVKYKPDLKEFVYFRVVFLLRTRAGVIQSWDCRSNGIYSNGMYSWLLDP